MLLIFIISKVDDLALSVPVTPLPAVVVPLVLEDGEEESGQLGHHLGKEKVESGENQTRNRNRVGKENW